MADAEIKPVPGDQDRLWAWIQHNVDYRVRSMGT